MLVRLFGWVAAGNTGDSSLTSNRELLIMAFGFLLFCCFRKFFIATLLPLIALCDDFAAGGFYTLDMTSPIKNAMWAHRKATALLPADPLYTVFTSPVFGFMIFGSRHLAFNSTCPSLELDIFFAQAYGICPFV